MDDTQDVDIRVNETFRKFVEVCGTDRIPIEHKRNAVPETVINISLDPVVYRHDVLEQAKLE